MDGPKHVGHVSSVPTEAEWLEFDKALGISDPSDHFQLSESSSSGTRSFDKIYALTFYSSDVPEKCRYCLYRVDVNSASNGMTLQSLEPIFCWDQDDHHTAFAVLGSKLYMFSGMDSNPRLQNCMSIYDMRRAPPSSTPTFIVEKFLKAGPKMCGSKWSPVAVVMGDSKICVFGAVLYKRYEYELFCPPSFELWDTKDLCWKSLPEPPIEYEDFETVVVQSYGVHRSCLIIQINKEGIYGINVDNPEPKWVYLDRSDRIGGLPVQGMWTMADKKLWSPFGAMRRGDPYLEKIAFKAPIERESLIRRYPCSALCFDDKCTELCIVRAGFQIRWGRPPNLLVDIVKFDDEVLKTLGTDLSKWQEIQSDRSFTFALTARPCNVVDLIACFPIKDNFEENQIVVKDTKEVVKEETPLMLPHGSGTGGGTRAGLFRTPISGGVQSETSAYGLPRPALAVRNSMEQAGFAHLCTVMSRMHHQIKGYPFGSLVDFVPDPMGHPIFSFSPLAIHTQNLLADPRCTLVTQIPGWTGLSNARVTIFGDVFPLPEHQQEWAHKQYIAKHHQGPSQQWGDFYYFRMQNISDIYIIGGCGTGAWVDVKEYEALHPDKIAVDGGKQNPKAALESRALSNELIFGSFGVGTKGNKKVTSDNGSHGVRTKDVSFDASTMS